MTIGTLGITPVAGFTSVVNSGTGTLTLGGDVTFTSATTGRAQVSGKLDLGSATRIFTVADGTGADYDMLVDAKVSSAAGTYGITKSGVGRLTLANTNNDFAGNIILGTNSGTLRITSSGALGTGTKTVTNTSASTLSPNQSNRLELDSNGGADISLASNISFSLSGANGVILNTAGNNTIAGNIGMTTGNGTVKILSDGGTLTLSGTVTANTTRDFELAGSSVGNIFSGVLQNNGGNIASLVKSGAGTWTVSGGSNTFTGNTKVTGGTLKLTNNLAIQNSVFDTSGAGTLDTQGVTTPTFGGLTAGGNLVLHSNVTSLTLKVADTQTYSGSLSGGTGLALAKSGAGTQILSNSNSYTGATSITGGVLQVAHNNALGTTSGVTMTANNSLQLANGITVTGRTITITGYGASVRGALQVAASSSAEWAGTVKLDTGDSRVGALGNGILTLSGVIENGAGNTFIVSAQDAASATPGKVIVSGTSNTYTGQTQIFRGTLAIGANNALPTGTVLNVHSASGIGDTAVFDLNNYNQQVAGLLRGNTSGPAIVTNTGVSSKTLTINNTSNYTFDSAITGNLALYKNGAGIQTLSGANTYTGKTTVAAGVLALSGSGSIASSTEIEVNGELDTTALAGWSLAGSQTLMGTGTVNAGTGKTFTVAASTTLAPGASPGQLDVTGNISFASASTYLAEIQPVGGPTADLVDVNGNFSITSGAILTLSLYGSDMLLTEGTKFALLSYSGAWNNVAFNTYADDSTFTWGMNQLKINYNDTTAGVNGGAYANNLTLTVVPEPSATTLGLLAAAGLLLRRRRSA